jgi:hypothetical protein
MYNKEKGSIAVLAALSLTLLIGLSVFVTDLGIIYVRQARLQNALDAAVLAGAQELPTSTTSAQTITEEYASGNGVSELSVDINADNTEISASSEGNVPAMFSRIWGIDENFISASAKAGIEAPASMTGIVPLSLPEQELLYGEEYLLKLGSGDHFETGWFGALDLDGSGAKDYEKNLTNGYSGYLNYGQIIDVENGNMSGPTKKAIENRLAKDTRIPKNTFADHDRDAPQIVYVPVVKILGIPIHEVQIVGFAAFFVEGITGTGKESIIQGRFLKTIVVKGKSKGTTTASDYGLYAVKLIS